jgi:hypothetical protein
MKRHSKRDVLCCWRNGLWAVARCIEKLKAARLESLTSTLYDNTVISNYFVYLTITPDMSLQQNTKAPLCQSLFHRKCRQVRSKIQPVVNRADCRTGVCPTAAACACLIILVRFHARDFSILSLADI